MKQVETNGNKWKQMETNGKIWKKTTSKKNKERKLEAQSSGCSPAFDVKDETGMRPRFCCVEHSIHLLLSAMSVHVSVAQFCRVNKIRYKTWRPANNCRTYKYFCQRACAANLEYGCWGDQGTEAGVETIDRLCHVFLPRRQDFKSSPARIPLPSLSNVESMHRASTGQNLSQNPRPAPSGRRSSPKPAHRLPRCRRSGTP